jgi:hypothetical protein
MPRPISPDPTTAIVWMSILESPEPRMVAQRFARVGG